jgi:hypothetical protein
MISANVVMSSTNKPSLTSRVDALADRVLNQALRLCLCSWQRRVAWASCASFFCESTVNQVSAII